MAKKGRGAGEGIAGASSFPLGCLSLPGGGGVYGFSAGLVFLDVFLLHFLMDNGVPGCLALALGNVVFPGPPPQPELFDKVQISHNATHHDPFTLSFTKSYRIQLRELPETSRVYRSGT